MLLLPHFNRGITEANSDLREGAQAPLLSGGNVNVNCEKNMWDQIYYFGSLWKGQLVNEVKKYKIATSSGYLWVQRVHMIGTHHLKLLTSTN